MRNPYEFPNEFEAGGEPLDECGGCGQLPHVTMMVDSINTPLCRDCLEDSTFVCAECVERYWMVDGQRIYCNPSLYCPTCAKEKQDALNVWWEQRQNEFKDDMNQRRR